MGWLIDGFENFERWRRWQMFAVLLAATLLVGYLDYRTGDQLSLYILFFPIISIAGWVLGFRTALAISFLSSILWVVDDYFEPYAPLPDFYKYWATLVRFGVFAIFAFVLSRLRASLDREQQLASHDSLTGLANRQWLFDLGERELARCRRSRSPITAIFLDCDGFKAVNDRLGHDAGDAVLRTVAWALQKNCRPTDVVARLGGDEFVVLISEMDATHVQEFATRLNAELLKTMTANGWAVTFSMGVATFRDVPTDIDEVIKAADDLMYVVKHHRKNGIEAREFGGGALVEPTTTQPARLGG